ncbi:hypothetical protein DLJ47_31400 [Micromonospora sp. S4605]|nr:hypothetical protein DLJ47_31400 [Micromonospora sp. S4605]
MLAAAFATIDFTLNSMVPAPRQPCAAPYLRLPRVCAVYPLYQVGWLFHVVLDEIDPVIHSFALVGLGLHVHACRCSMRNCAARMCLPATNEVFIRNIERMMWSAQPEQSSVRPAPADPNVLPLFSAEEFCQNELDLCLLHTDVHALLTIPPVHDGSM